MGRLTRAQAQERNRAKVLAAARDEFMECGYRDARIDDIAESAELTRGAVYSNFPSKRALYFAVLADEAGRASDLEHIRAGSTPATALGAFARAWAARLPLLTEDPNSASRLDADLVPEILADARLREPYVQLTRLAALLLGLALERMHAAGAAAAGAEGTRVGVPRPSRRVQVAETALTTLHGARQLAAAAPGFIEPFTIVAACERLATLELDDTWQPPHLPHVPRARPAGDPWTPPHALDVVRAEGARLDGAVVAFLGLHRLAAVEEAVRAAPAGTEVAAVIVTGDAGELAPLARLVVADVRTCLCRAFPRWAWPRLQVIHDESGALAAAAGVPAVSDTTEAAVRTAGGRIVARADGFGACHAAATTPRAS